MQQTSATRLMSASWHQALGEAKRQYEAIDRALEVSASGFLRSKFVEKLLVHQLFKWGLNGVLGVIVYCCFFKGTLFSWGGDSC